ncbi:WYL domain-containing protein [Polaribacter sp.]|uniref:WYL domain-containing protein n=1 Tax=Polaribacter sp. TaxID=1920175 RepID=UPI003F6C89AE
MKNKNKLFILNSVFNSPFAISKTNLLEILKNNDIQISKRTLERYLKELIDHFFIEFSRDKKGYIKNTLLDNNELNLYVQYLNINVLSQQLIHFSENTLKNKKFIISENIVFKGIEYIDKILLSLDKKSELSFTYNKQYSQKEKRDVIPLFLKEYQKRWYLLALDKNRNNELRTFGLDRIEYLQIKTNVKTKINTEPYRQVFKNVIGLDLRPSNSDFPKPIKVLLKAINLQPHYFKSLPFHESQKILEEKEDFTIFKYKLLVNYELIQNINMYRPFLEVISPEWLKERVNE